MSSITVEQPGRAPFERRVGDQVRLLILAGIPVGVLVAGVGSRLAMLMLRLTSPSYVVGMESDDGFEIGRFTLSGTYSLLTLGGLVGIIGAACYQWVRPWLLGPRWFQVVTVAAASGAVVGSMLVHADGIDFVVLQPTWLAISAFVALPAVFGAATALVVDAVQRRSAGSGTKGWRRWLPPLALAVAVPPTLVLLAVATFVVAAWEAAGGARDGIRRRRFVRVAIRTAWLGVAVLGLAALVNDIAEIRRVT